MASGLEAVFIRFCGSLSMPSHGANAKSDFGFGVVLCVLDSNLAPNP